MSDSTERRRPVPGDGTERSDVAEGRGSTGDEGPVVGPTEDGGPTDDGEPATTVERRSPESAFGLLASDVRVGILRALGERPDGSLPFSALHDRVDVADSGNFNYHLGELTGTFVRKTGAGEYELTLAGKRVVGAMYAGTYTTEAVVEPIAVGWDCLLCGGELLVSYADERAAFRCADCGKGATFAFPAGSVERFDRAALPEAFARWYHQSVTRIADGFCSFCAGRLTGELASLPGGTEADPQPSEAVFTCRRCGNTARLSGTGLATTHPIVRGFLAEHGFDVTARHPSQIWGELDRFDTEIRSEEPPRIEVVFAVDGERVRVDVDEDAELTNARREPVEG